MRVVALLTVVLLLAGCAANNPAPSGAGPGTPQGTRDLPVGATADGRGALQGIVVDSVIRPLPGINVTLQHPGDAANQTVTDAEGNFLFQHVAPGAYSLATHHGRYLDQVQAVVVSAGDVAKVRIVLEPLVSNRAFFTQLHFSGFVECSFSGSNTCAAINLATGEPTTNDNALPFFEGHWTGYHRTPDWIQTETTWEPTATAVSSISICHTAASREEFDAGDPYHIAFFWDHDGPPAFMAWNQSFAQENELGTVRDPVYLATNGPFSFLPDPPVSKDYRVGVALEQSFDLYLTTFYGYTPPVEWRFLEAGDVPAPPV